MVHPFNCVSNFQIRAGCDSMLNGSDAVIYHIPIPPKDVDHLVEWALPTKQLKARKSEHYSTNWN